MKGICTLASPQPATTTLFWPYRPDRNKLVVKLCGHKNFSMGTET